MATLPLRRTQVLASYRFAGIRRSDPRRVQIAILAIYTLLAQTVLPVLVLPGTATVTADHWGSAVALLFVLLNVGNLMTYRVRRAHLIAAFWGTYAACQALLLLLQHQPLYLWWGGVSAGAVLLVA